MFIKKLKKIKKLIIIRDFNDKEQLNNLISLLKKV